MQQDSTFFVKRWLKMYKLIVVQSRQLFFFVFSVGWNVFKKFLMAICWTSQWYFCSSNWESSSEKIKTSIYLKLHMASLWWWFKWNDLWLLCRKSELSDPGAVLEVFNFIENAEDLSDEDEEEDSEGKGVTNVESRTVRKPLSSLHHAVGVLLENKPCCL